MSDHHYSLVVSRSPWCVNSSIQENVMLGFSESVSQDGTIAIYVPSDTVADLRALLKKINK